MSDSTQRPVVNDPIQKTVEANLAEVKQTIEAIEAQLLEAKSCIRSIEAVQQPTFTTEQLRALARKFFDLGAEAQREEVNGSEIEPYISIDGEGDGLRWSYEGYYTISPDYWVDEVSFNSVAISDDEIDEVLGQTQAE